MGIFDQYWLPDQSGNTGLVERNMKQVGPAMKEVFGERVPNPQLTGPATAAEAAQAAGGAGGRGLLARAAGAALGPVGMGVQMAVAPGDLGDGTRNGEAGNYPSYSPEEQAAAGQWMKGVTDRAAQAGTSQINPQAPTNIPTAAQPQSVTVPQESSSQAQASVPQTQLPEVQAAIKQAQAKQIETQRQTIQAGAAHQLANNSLSRMECAQAVVTAQEKQTGQALTPEAKKAAVQEEVGSMRRMDNTQLSTYLSYALLGLGAVAAVMDKSGGAANAFAGSFVNTLNSQQAQRLKWAEFYAKQQQQQFDNKLALNKDGREGRSADRDDKKFALDSDNIHSQIDDRKVGRQIDFGRLNNDTAQVGIAQQNANTNAFNASTNASQGAANLALRNAEFGLKQDMAPAEKEYKLAQVKKANAEAGKAELGDVANLNQKEAVNAVDTYIKDQKDVKISDGAKEQVAVEWRRLREMPANRNLTDRQLLEKAFQNSQVGKAKRSVLGWQLDPEIRAQ